MKKPFFGASAEAKGKIRSTLACRVGKVILICSVLVFCECVAVNDKLTCGVELNVLEYEIEELKELFKPELTFDWLSD